MDLYTWIQKKGAVNNPNKKYWSVAITLGGMDIYGKADTIQKAYIDLRTQIENSTHLMKAFANL